MPAAKKKPTLFRPERNPLPAGFLLPNVPKGSPKNVIDGDYQGPPPFSVGLHSLDYPLSRQEPPRTDDAKLDSKLNAMIELTDFLDDYPNVTSDLLIHAVTACRNKSCLPITIKLNTGLSEKVLKNIYGSDVELNCLEDNIYQLTLADPLDIFELSNYGRINPY